MANLAARSALAWRSWRFRYGHVYFSNRAVEFTRDGGQVQRICQQTSLQCCGSHPGIFQRADVGGLKLKERSLRDQDLRIRRGALMVFVEVKVIGFLRIWKHSGFISLHYSAGRRVALQHRRGEPAQSK